MNPAHRFTMLGRQQLSLQEGIQLLGQIQRELGSHATAARAWGSVALMAQASLVPLNIIVNSLPLSPAKTAFDLFTHVLRACTTGDAAWRGDGRGATVPWAFEAAKRAIEHELKKKGAADLVPGAGILLGLAEDSMALVESAQAVSEGSSEMRRLARQMQQRIDAMRRKLTALGTERAQAADLLLLRQRTA
ncbi:MAG: hypothetical protein KGI90_16890 [Burkholderiales bacterium]|nr:hypothetical protein [Burkholderiales bacterium]